jgi:hypothetical protein
MGAQQEVPVTIWFTVQLDDRPGALARVAQALADTNGALMLTTSDAAATREAFTALGVAFEDHDPTAAEPTGLSISDVVAGRLA